MKRLDITSTHPANPTSPASASLRHPLGRGTESGSLAATQCIALGRGTLNDRLETLRATFEKNRHRYAFRRRAVIDEMFVLATTDLHLNALGETLDAWLPSIESLDYAAPRFPHAMAA